MLHYRSTGNLAIKPCEICGVLVLHEEGERLMAAYSDIFELQHGRWRAFPHNAPGGPSCIGGGAAARALRETAQSNRYPVAIPSDLEPA